MSSSSGIPDGPGSTFISASSIPSTTSPLRQHSATAPIHRSNDIHNDENDDDDEEEWTFQNLYQQQRNKRRKVKQEDFQKKYNELARRHQQLQNEIRAVVEKMNQKQSEKVRLNNLVRAKNKTVEYLRAVLKRSESLNLTQPHPKEESAISNAATAQSEDKDNPSRKFLTAHVQISENEESTKRINTFLETTEKMCSNLRKSLISASTSEDADIVFKSQEEDDATVKIIHILHECNHKASELTSQLAHTNSQLMVETAKSEALEKTANNIQKDLKEQVTELEVSYEKMEEELQKARDEKDVYRAKLHLADKHILITTKRFEDRKVELKSDLKAAIDKSVKRKQEVLELNERIKHLETQLEEKRQVVETVTEKSQEEGQVKESDEEFDSFDMTGALTQMVTSYGEKMNDDGEDDQDGNRVKELMAKARRLLEASVSRHLQQRLGVSKERTHDASYKLYNQINDLRDKCLFPMILIDAMHDMRLIGNASAHHGKPPPTRADAERVMFRFAKFEQMFESGKLQTRTSVTPFVGAYNSHSTTTRGVRFA